MILFLFFPVDQKSCGRKNGPMLMNTPSQNMVLVSVYCCLLIYVHHHNKINSTVAVSVSHHVETRLDERNPYSINQPLQHERLYHLLYAQCAYFLLLLLHFFFVILIEYWLTTGIEKVAIKFGVIQ